MVPIAEVASAYVSILPSARGFGSKLDGQISGDVTASGKKAGSGWGKAFGIGAALVIGAKAISFLGDSLGEAREAQVIGARTANVIKKMGNAANISADGVSKLAGAISAKTGIDDEAIQSGQNLLLTFGNIRNEAGKGNDIFNQTSQLMVDMSAAMGTDAKGSAIQLGKALNDPIKGLTALSRVGVSFTAQQQEQIKAFAEGGEQMKAQKIILGELERQFGGAAESMASPADKAAVAWGNFKEQIGTALLPVVDRLLTTFTVKIVPALSKFASFVGSTVGPIIQSVANAFRGGSNAGGQFAGFIDRVAVAARTLAQWISGTVIPAVKGALVPVIARGRAEFAKLKAAVQQNQPQLQQLLGGLRSVANFVATRVVPVLVKLHAQTFVNLIAGVRFVINVVSAGVNAFNNIRSAVVRGGEAIGRFATAVREKIDSAVNTVKGFPDRLLSIFTTLGGQMYLAGTKIVGMLASGIRNAAESAVQELKNLAGKLGKFVPGSPVREGPLKSLNNGHAGAMIPQMLADGINKNADAPVKAMGKVAKKLKDKLSGVRDNLTSALDGLKGDFKSLSESVSSAFTGNLFEAATGSDFVANLMGKRGELTSLLGSFKTLKGWGLDPAFLSQLFASGNGALITELAGMGQAGATQAGALFGEVTSLSNQLGNAVAKNDPVSDRIDITNKKLDAVIDRLDRVGGDVGKAVNGAVVGGHKSGKRGKK